MATFEILFGGAETTVQDAGAQGWLRKGVAPSGAQDNYSFRVGNILLKNPENAAALEIARRVALATDAEKETASQK